MRLVHDGNAQAFGALYDRFASRAYRLARSMVRDEHRAQDVVQEAFLSVWRSRSSYAADRGSVAGWILGTVRHRAIDSHRRGDRHHSRRADRVDAESQPTGADDLEHEIAERDQAHRLRRRLAALPEPQRDVIALAYFGELSAGEIARHLSVPLGTVKGRMRLGLKRLRADMHDHSGTESPGRSEPPRP